MLNSEGLNSIIVEIISNDLLKCTCSYIGPCFLFILWIKIDLLKIQIKK